MCAQLTTPASELVNLSRYLNGAGFSQMDDLKRYVDDQRTAVQLMVTNTQPGCGIGEKEEEPDSAATSDNDDFEWLVIERTGRGDMARRNTYNKFGRRECESNLPCGFQLQCVWNDTDGKGNDTGKLRTTDWTSRRVDSRHCL